MTEFTELIGLHKLSGLETSVEKLSDHGYGYDNGTYIYFILDGVTYLCTENPGDGYRSSMGSFEVVTEYAVRNTFPEQLVFGKMRPDGYDRNDTIEFFDAESGNLVLALGTDAFDDWYPTFIFSWHPENMAINKDANDNEDESGLVGKI